ncbi:MAG TPA: EAL domain-containing protein, partial [Rudaea sp.]
MSFRLRLASFLIASLAIVQVLTAVLVYEVARRQLIGQGERELSLAASVFTRQLDDVADRVAGNVQILTLDYALRAAIAQHDRDTVLSALRNHGRRVGAARMMLVRLDGTVEADTAQTAPLTHFPYTDLLNDAFGKPSAAVVALDGRAYWLVVVPVSAPALIGLIAAAIPIDDTFILRLQEQSTFPKTIEIATESEPGQWRVVAQGAGAQSLASNLAPTRGANARDWPQVPTLTNVRGTEYVAMATRLHSSAQSTPIVAVLGFSLDEALRPFHSVGAALAALLALGLALALIGAVLIARGVSRPVEVLAEAARRIAAGDYSPPPPIPRRDEIGELAAALTNMTQAIGEREERIRFQSGHDAVTGLPNRVAAENAIQQQLAIVGHTRGALLMVALTRLPEIVKTMGHAISDRLMRYAAERIRQPAGNALVARATDTEFLVWIRDADQTAAIALAFRILDVLGEPYQEADLSLDAAPSVGIALYPQHGGDASALLQRAEVALFTAVGAEEAVVVYNPAADPHRPERLSLMSELREALDRDELKLHYQPRLNLKTRQIDGVESLVRWTHPKLGPIAPDAFIPLAEETGNIRRLTRWVLATSIAQSRAWLDHRLDLRFSINLSARDLDDADLPRRVSELLSIHHVPAKNVLLEITESAVMGKP